MTKPMARSVVAPPEQAADEPAQRETTVSIPAVGGGTSCAFVEFACRVVLQRCALQLASGSAGQHCLPRTAVAACMTPSAGATDCVAADCRACYGGLCRPARHGKGCPLRGAHGEADSPVTSRHANSPAAIALSLTLTLSQTLTLTLNLNLTL